HPAAAVPQAPTGPHPQTSPHPPAPTGPHPAAPVPSAHGPMPQAAHAQGPAQAHAPVGPPQAAFAGAVQGSVGPWQQYDPWAGPVSLSGSGGPVGDRPRRGRKALVLGAVLIALVSGGVGGAIGSYVERNGGTDVELPQAGVESKGRAPDSVAGIAARALPGVVTIHTKGSSEQGTGTGFVLDKQGHILTNNHVVEPAGSDGEISVTFAGGESADAQVVGHDSGYDLAVIKVDGVRGLKPLPLGNSENVQVGDPVVAIGAPFDLANTVTSGIISAKERPITAGGEKGDGSDVSYVDALQTDAPINPGNSGGPLVDSKARVIGINSAIRSADSGSELDGGQAGSIGLGFAIPVNQAKRVAEELINTGKATHPVIGVTLDMDYSGDGARVGTKGNSGGSAVTPGGPGDKAGIEPRDVITAVDGVRVHSGEELIVKIRAHRPKDKLELTVERNGKERKVALVLGAADGT
ncbi:S1C family serine protease, partial [Streptomyces longispororuber]|uniref:S1C family serine protease n=1 Tax=Streptomyces longispororuber TaxID=68230 RepID=UPI00210A708A